MKTKISIFFLILAVALVSILLKPGLFTKDSPQASAPDAPKDFSKASLLSYLQNPDFISYLDHPVKLDQAAIEAADIINIHFWASWCAPCVNEVPELIEFARRVSVKNEKNLKVLFITVSLDESREELQKFLKSFPEFDKDPFVRIWDKNKSFAKLVDADRLPMTVILNKVIPEPRIVRGVVEWKSIQL